MLRLKNWPKAEQPYKYIGLKSDIKDTKKSLHNIRKKIVNGKINKE